ncbi:MAG: hypothetical protein QFB87_03740 [Patescibacteria group bacterium]|nr:hypothetical protein [Patescibacteria group bacterium]
MELFSSVEQISLEQRILQDAEFIKGGARVNQLGALVLTQAQVAEAYYEGDPSVMQVLSEAPVLNSEAKTAKDSWLDQSLESLVAQYETPPNTIGSPAARTVLRHSLARNGIEDVRNLLVFGSAKLFDLQGVGSTIVNVAEKIVNDNEYGFTLKNMPTHDELRMLCSDLDKITVGAALEADDMFKGCTISKMLLLSPHALVLERVSPDAENIEKYLLRAIRIKTLAEKFAVKLNLAN